MKNFLCILTMLVVLAGCQHNEIVEERRFSAVLEEFGKTRTSLDDANRILWSKEDLIAVFEDNDTYSRYQIIPSSAGQSSAEFFLMAAARKTAAIGADVAVYPFGESLSLSQSSAGDYLISGISLPAVQKYSGSSFASGSFPMVAVSESGSGVLAFKNVCGALKLYLTGSDAVSSLSVKGNDGELLSGPFDVTASFDALPYMTAASGAGTELTLDCGPDGVMLDEDVPVVFTLALPPVDFAKGFTVTVRSVDGGEMVIKTEKPNPIRRSGVLNMPPVVFRPSVDGLVSVDIDAVSIRFDGIDICVNVLNVAEYAGGYKLKKDFNLSGVVREANWKSVPRYKGSCVYQGPLSSFPSGAPGVSLSSGQTYVVWVAPYAEGVKSVKAEDIVYEEFTVPEIHDGGSVDVSSVGHVAELKSLEVSLSAPGASVIYAALLQKIEYAGLVSQKDMIEYLLKCSNPGSGSEMTVGRDGLSPGETVYLLALAIDEDGRHGAILIEEYATAVVAYNDDILVGMDVTYEGKTAKVSVSASGADIAGYYYFHGQTSSSSWKRILGGTRESAEHYIAVNNDNYVIGNTEDEPLVDGNIVISGLQMESEYVVVVMAYDSEGRLSRAYMQTFIPQLDLGDFVYNTGDTQQLWRDSKPSVVFGDCHENGEFYTVNWSVTPAEGMTAYAACAHPNSLEGYSDPKAAAVRIFNLGDVVVPGKMVNMFYGDKGNVVYVIWKDQNGNFYEAYSVAIPQN